MNKLFTIIFCFFCFSFFAQTSTLRINLQIDFSYDNRSMIYVLQESDTIYKNESIITEYIEIEDLESGVYKIHFYNDLLFEEDKAFIQKTALLEDGKTTVITLNYHSFEPTVSESGSELEETEPSDLIKTEFQTNFGYFNSRWTDPNSIIKGNFSIGYSTFGWYTFSKHIGILYGGGIGFSQHYFDKDTTLFSDVTTSRKAERYASININHEMKFRFSTGNQQDDGLNSAKLFVDVGAGYYLPIVFNHTAVYAGNKKAIEKRIHRFNDFRAFVSIGFAPVTVFFEYRLSNFIKGDNPQLPRYNAGIKFVIPMDE